MDAVSELEWTARHRFWGGLLRLKFSQTKPLSVPEPTAAVPIAPVPFAHRYPDIPISGVFVADHAPADERDLKVRLFCALQAWLERRFGPMQGGLPPVAADPFAALAAAYPPANVKLYRAPVRPPGYDPLDLGLLAVASPYFCYLERVGEEKDRPVRYRWDLAFLEQYPCHPGVRSPWAVVELECDEPGDDLRAVRIECALGTCEPGDADWDAAQRLAMCAVSTHLTLVRHFNWLHLVCGASLGIATHNCLPAKHPVRVLLQPHVYATSFGNEIVTRVALEPGGDFENMFSFTHRGMCDLLSDSVEEFDLTRIHPERDANARRVADAAHGKALDNRLELWRVIRAHVARYLAAYYATDADLRGDLPFTHWLDTLDASIPNGVTKLVGSPVTIAGATELLATFIYMTTVEHEILDSNVYDYQLWNDVQPVRVYENGAAPPVDVYQRLVSYNFILSVDRTLLMSDFSSLAPDAAGRAEFAQFRRDLADLQAQMSCEPPEVWRIEPRMLRANMNY